MGSCPQNESTMHTGVGCAKGSQLFASNEAHICMIRFRIRVPVHLAKPISKGKMHAGLGHRMGMPAPTCEVDDHGRVGLFNCRRSSPSHLLTCEHDGHDAVSLVKMVGIKSARN
eukprot:1158264-Pelagomonas_calceolata.AAC.6